MNCKDENKEKEAGNGPFLKKNIKSAFGLTEQQIGLKVLNNIVCFLIGKRRRQKRKQRPGTVYRKRSSCVAFVFVYLSL